MFLRRNVIKDKIP